MTIEGYLNSLAREGFTTQTKTWQTEAGAIRNKVSVFLYAPTRRKALNYKLVSESEADSLLKACEIAWNRGIKE